MKRIKLTGWNDIVNTIIVNHFKNGEFNLQQLYEFEPFFKNVYPDNNHIKEKIRQTLQNLRDFGIIKFLTPGVYEYTELKVKEIKPKYQKQVVYLLSNDSVPNWVKIGRTKQIDRRLKELYNKSVPTPFKLEAVLETDTLEKSSVLERSIHSVLDTINPDLRKNTEATKREFFNMSTETGKHVFELVARIMDLGVRDTL